MNNSRSSFSGKFGFILAASASAVGLGNIWRFPYVAAKYGGGIFLLIYMILVLTVGCSLMLAEIAIGRKADCCILDAFKTLDKRFAFIGVISTIIPAVILSYYCVIGGWILKYLAEFSLCHIQSVTDNSFFANFISQTWSPLLWFIIFIGSVSIIVYLGIEKGVERSSKLLMPFLVVLTFFVAGYACFLPGAKEGIIYYLKPDFTKFSLESMLAAMSQTFYSLSIAMGILVNYGAYVKKNTDIVSSVKYIAIFDTVIALVIGLMVIPAVFVFLGEDSISAGPGLIFITLPKVFNSMKGGAFIGTVFFLLVFFAALTSAISLMETVVDSIQYKFRTKRKPAMFMTIAIALVLGSLSSLGNGILSSIKIMGMDFLSFFDYISNNIMMPVTAICTCIFIGYFLKPKTLIDEIELSGPFKAKAVFVLSIKYFAPICIGIILISQFF
ncbi:MAG: sodium-dependent transporter [Spirochaetia bacterium]|nr:sodium-dependent transporter [Spirochaetia bacterium]